MRIKDKREAIRLAMAHANELRRIDELGRRKASELDVYLRKAFDQDETEDAYWDKKLNDYIDDENRLIGQGIKINGFHKDSVRPEWKAAIIRRNGRLTDKPKYEWNWVNILGLLILVSPFIIIALLE